jgi:hypothetical protein
MFDRLEKTRTVKGTDSVRQGVTGHNVRWVLLINTFAAIIGPRCAAVYHPQGVL